MKVRASGAILATAFVAVLIWAVQVGGPKNGLPTGAANRVPGIPWKPFPARALSVRAVKACAPPGAHVRVSYFLNGQKAWMGVSGPQVYSDLVVVNRSALPCGISGRPRLLNVLAPSGRPLPVTIQRAAGQGWANAVVLLPGQEASAPIVWTEWCPFPVPPTITLVIRMPGYHHPVRLRHPSVECGIPGGNGGSWMDLLGWNPPEWARSFRVRIEDVGPAAPGHLLRFTVLLMNASRRPLPLPVCPPYTEGLDAPGQANATTLAPVGVSRTYSLNCLHLHGVLPARRWIRFAMALPIPSNLFGGPGHCGCSVGWSLVSSYSSVQQPAFVSIRERDSD